MKIISAEFVKSAFKPEDYPSNSYPEVAFAGRSNVGKSSLINTLVNRKNLARISSTPGRTQAINFFCLNHRIFLVDLPGYGYAKVPVEIKRQWKPMVEAYLKKRGRLKLVVVIIDARREPSTDDINLMEWLRFYKIPVLVVLTKIDKIPPAQRIPSKLKTQKILHLDDRQIVLFSAVTGEGKDELWKKILENL